MDEKSRTAWDSFTEEIEVAGTQLLDEVNRLIAEGNLSRLQVRTEKGDLYLSIPLTAGAVAGGVVAVLAAVAGIATKVKLEIVRTPEAAPAEAGTA